MSQYKTELDGSNGTVTVTNGSAAVTGLGTAFIGNALAGHSFKIAGENADYQVSVDATNDLALTISPAYAGATQSGAAFIIQRDYTSLGLSEISPNDADWAYRLTHGVIRKVDSLISGLLEGYAVVSGWNAATNSPVLPTAVGNNGKRYIVTTPGATLIDGAGPWGVGDSACSNGTVYFRVPAAVAISAANVAELTGSANSILHFHATDRDLANATGLLPAAMITQDATHRMLTDAKIATYDGFIEGRTYKGLWDASTNTPATPAAATENNGWYYRTSVAGNGYSVGDVKISNGTTWERVASADAPAIHGDDHLPGGIDPIPLATLTTPGLIDLTTFKLMLDVYFRVSLTLPEGLAADGVWIDPSNTPKLNPSIAALFNQAGLYSEIKIISIFIDDPKDVGACTLAITSSNSVDMPATEPEMVFTGTGGVRTLTIAALAAPASSTLTVTVTNADGLTSQIAFQYVAGAQLFTVTTSAGANGTITATQTIAQGGAITITATPDSGYRVATLVVDGVVQVGATYFTDNDVQEDYVISATFEMEYVVNLFTVGTPSGLTVPVTAYSDADFYLITESATPPTAGAAGWSAVKPTSYTTTGGGTKTLYPWKKTAGGQVSEVFPTPRTVEFPIYSVDFGTYANGALPTVWSPVTGQTAPLISGGKLVGNVGADGMGNLTTVLPNDQFAEVTGIVLAGTDGVGMGVTCRSSNTAKTAYFAVLIHSGAAYTIYLQRYVAGVYTLLGSFVTTSACTGVRIKAVGTTISVDAYTGSWTANRISVTNASIASGNAGVYIGGRAVDSMTGFNCGPQS